MAYLSTIQFPDENKDAFKQLKVSTSESLGDYKQVSSDVPYLIDTLEENGGVAIYERNEAASYLSATTTSNSRVVKQTREYHKYEAGKSQQFILTGLLISDTGNTTCVSRMGCFDDDGDKTVDSGGNGIYLEYSGGTVSLVRRSFATGTVVEERVNQANWSLDSLDGNGPSGRIINWERTMITIIEYEWLGVGVVNVSFDFGDRIVVGHQFVNNNKFDKVYMSTPNLPVRYEITQNAAGGDSAYMKYICASVNSQGGTYGERGLQTSTGVDNAISVGGTNTGLLAIRLKPDQNRVTIIPLEVDVSIAAGEYQYEVWVNAGITGGVWSDVSTFSSAQKNDTITSIDLDNGEAYCIETRYLNETSKNVAAGGGNVFSDDIHINSDIQGDTGNILIVARKLDGRSADVRAALKWKELK